MKLSKIRAGLAGVLWTVSVGCTTLTPASFGAKAPAVTVPAETAITVDAVLTGAGIGRFNASGAVFEIELDAFSGELARLLSESLSEAGATLGSGPTIHVQVDYMDFMFQGPCLLDYHVTLGESATFGQQSRGDSSNFALGCRAALSSAVSQIVGDERTRRFIEEN